MTTENETPDYEKTWKEFWEPLVTTEDGQLNLDQIKRELHDARVFMSEGCKVYDHITGGRISKITTDASVVCAVADDYSDECFDEEDRGMCRLLGDVRDFHRVMGQPVLRFPEVPALARVQLRGKLIYEECEEVMEALGARRVIGDTAWEFPNQVDLIGLADGLADLTYVVVGTALEFGIPLDRVWDEVQRSNMAKRGPDGTVKFREDGKVEKPEGWTPPDISTAVLGELG
jgi:predicted HAD superfamily Cof-like phosphohydrolase